VKVKFIYNLLNLQYSQKVPESIEKEFTYIHTYKHALLQLPTRV